MPLALKPGLKVSFKPKLIPALV